MQRLYTVEIGVDIMLYKNLCSSRSKHYSARRIYRAHDVTFR